ncbi:MAG: class A beta-lactamase-related serine hydrolase [Synergistaceae bacterium]|jgi:beta-lactamase class A|nr:class A beta-lactamase-related serine hydrolase [Synergistaceae bacterium]
MKIHEEYTLENRIKREIMSFSGIMGVYADDLKGRVVEMNPDEEFETASTIKSFILADLYSQVNEGTKKLSDMLSYTESCRISGSGVLKSLEIGTELSVRNLAVLMITVSDNVATNMLIDYLGLGHINGTTSALGFERTKLHRRITDSGGEDGGWPPLGTTTPREYGRLFTMIAKEELVSPEASREMTEIFKQQCYNSTLTSWLPPYYLDKDNFGEAGTEIYVASKSGSMDDCRNDGGIVGTPYGKYVIAIMTKGFRDRQYHKEHESHIYGARVSRLLFDQYLALGHF